MDGDPIANLRGFEKFRGGAMDQIGGIGGQRRVTAGELDSVTAAGEGEPVMEVDRMEEGFQFVKAIRPPTKDVLQQINFAGRQFFQGHHCRLVEPRFP